MVLLYQYSMKMGTNMKKIFTVSQVNNYIKDIFVRDYVLNHIYMKGEVSNCKYHTSGHIYFTLKDETGQMACVMFASQRTGLNFRMEEGQSVIVLGSINVYERDGKYQMYAKEIRLDGVGILYERFEQLKQKLSVEGLFDTSHKKAIPAMPKSVGIVTASTGAAIQDIVNISKRRNPYVQLILYPAQVQGMGAAETIVKGIHELDKLGVDTIIIGRGGGQIEDLWAFNEESVAKAIYECSTPIISAVGHETDITISDFVSDLRAPTPSAAAELAVNEIGQVLSILVDYHVTLTQDMMRKISINRDYLERVKMRLSYVSPTYQIRQKRQQAVSTSDQLDKLFRRKLEYKKHEFSLYIEKLKGLSPIAKLNQGYSYVSDADGKVIKSVDKVNVGDNIAIDVTDGRIYANIDKIEKIKP